MYLPFNVDGGSVGLAVGEAEGVGEEEGVGEDVEGVVGGVVNDDDLVGVAEGVVGDGVGVGFIFNTYNGLLFGA